MATIVGVSASAESRAHTLMAAEALRKVASDQGHDIKIECRGLDETSSPLGAEDIAKADLVILAIDQDIDQTPFKDLGHFQNNHKPGHTGYCWNIGPGFQRGRITGASKL